VKPRFVDIDGRRYLWSDILELRRVQLSEWREAQQPVLFELKIDARPEQGRTAVRRYLEPSLFER
jgi:hypothetical protein